LESKPRHKIMEHNGEGRNMSSFFFVIICFVIFKEVIFQNTFTCRFLIIFNCYYLNQFFYHNEINSEILKEAVFKDLKRNAFIKYCVSHS